MQFTYYFRPLCRGIFYLLREKLQGLSNYFSIKSWRICCSRPWIFERGKAVQEATSIKEIWQDDFVSFAYGCSFSFEYALLKEGVDLAYLRRGQREALYITNIDTTPHGRFAGKIVASMRPFHPNDAIKAIVVTEKYPLVHGAPIHVALPHLIGIDLTKP